MTSSDLKELVADYHDVTSVHCYSLPPHGRRKVSVKIARIVFIGQDFPDNLRVANMPAITTSNAFSYLNPDTPSSTPSALPLQPQCNCKQAKRLLHTSLPSNPTTTSPKSTTPSASSSPPYKQVSTP
ncbi:hypothetical protein E2C01_045429 [Portunus trituberculatus]|uniref:Uncharacterized protein n=1 Tax=Portunus trituberculatus TaxID=210409 RepID=A0A5B7FUZ3_PORTR|nr:hypothetical protein [Portunus trituberculatus]